MEITEGGIDKIGLITKRNVERKLELEKRKHDKDNLAADDEKLDFFQETFSTKCAEIETSLSRADEIQKQSLPDHFNGISKDILLLQKYVANSNLFIRTYDIKKCQERLQDLTAKLKKSEEELLPKKKFGFKNKTKTGHDEKKPGRDQVDFHKAVAVPKQICGFANRSGELLEITGDAIYKKDVTLESVDGCKVKIFGSPSTLHLNFVKNCDVFSGPVSTSIFAENCKDCTLVIACQQLRLHASENVNIYLHVTSRAIMEDCHNIRVAPYNLDYPNIDQDFKNSGLDRSINNWKCVDDFNWLNVERQSPNWSLLDKEKCVDTWEFK